MATARVETGVRQSQITQTALELLAEKGVKSVSMAAVAGRVGLVPSALYRHFQSKDEILVAALDLLQTKHTENVALATAETDHAIEQLRLLYDVELAMMRESMAVPRVLFSDDLVQGHPVLQAKVREVFGSIRRVIVQVIEDGQAKGEIRQDAAPDTLTLMFIGMCRAIGAAGRMAGPRFDTRKHAAEAWNVFHSALTGNGKIA